MKRFRVWFEDNLTEAPIPSPPAPPGGGTYFEPGNPATKRQEPGRIASWFGAKAQEADPTHARYQAEYERLGDAKFRDLESKGLVDYADERVQDWKAQHITAAFVKALNDKITFGGSTPSPEVTNQISPVAQTVANAFAKGGHLGPEAFEQLIIAIHQDDKMDEKAREYWFPNISTIMTRILEPTYNQLPDLWYRPQDQTGTGKVHEKISLDSGSFDRADELFEKSPYRAKYDPDAAAAPEAMDVKSLNAAPTPPQTYGIDNWPDQVKGAISRGDIATADLASIKNWLISTVKKFTSAGYGSQLTDADWEAIKKLATA